MTTYSTQEVADRLGISIFTIRRHIRAGRLVARQHEGHWTVRREDLNRFLQSREIPVFPTTGSEWLSIEENGREASPPPDLPPSSART